MILSQILGQRNILIRWDRDEWALQVRVEGGHTRKYLNILRTSRQVYIEAHQVFWSTNNFNFTEPTGLKYWMAGRTPQEKRLIRSLQLCIHISNNLEIGNRPANWNNALCGRVVKSLSGLRDLRLSICQRLYHKGSNDQNVDIEYVLKGALLGVERFAQLPLKNIKISMVNFLKVGTRNKPLARWKTERSCRMQAVAKQLREKLLQAVPATRNERSDSQYPA